MLLSKESEYWPMNIKKKILSNNFLPSLPWGLLNPFFINRRLLADAIKTHANQINGKILDYGCGSKPYQTLFKFNEYIGVDIENPGHSHANENVDVFFDGKTLPFADNTFDSCFSSEVLEHVFDIDASLKEISRILKPNGKILITTPFVWDEHEAPHDYCRYTSFGLKDVLERNGFKIIVQKKNGSFLQLILQLTLIHFNRKLATNIFLKYPFFLIICPLLNLISLFSLMGHASDKTIYLGHSLIAKKTF